MKEFTIGTGRRYLQSRIAVVGYGLDAWTRMATEALQVGSKGEGSGRREHIGYSSRHYPERLSQDLSWITCAGLHVALTRITWNRYHIEKTCFAAEWFPVEKRRRYADADTCLV
jgi:hypothetical protein